jgi:predicted phosphodiesterase
MKAPSVTHRWKKLLAVGCSHGGLADPNALAAVLRFKAKWKPDTTIHLGDFCDCTAFRSGAKGSNDESAPVRPDFDSGLQFIRDLQPSTVLCGNHEDRLWRLRAHHSAIVSELASQLVASIETTCDSIKAKLIPWDYKQFVEIGTWKFMHGVFYNEMACRDHAEAYGNVVFAHTHRAGLQKGRRCDNPTGICVGTLTRVENMDYAKSRRATLGWCGGFVWGVYHDTRGVMWLHEQPQEEAEWVLPT